MSPGDTDGAEEVDLDGLEDVSKLEEADLPGIDDDSPQRSEQPPQQPVQPEGDPLDQVDEAIRKVEKDLDTEAARRATQSRTREDTSLQLRELYGDLLDLAPQTTSEAGLVDNAKTAISEARHAWAEAEDLESLDVVVDKIKVARRELEIAARAVPKRPRPPKAHSALSPPIDPVEQLFGEIDQEVDSATRERLLKEIDEIVDKGARGAPDWISPVDGKTPKRPKPPITDPLDGSSIGDLEPFEDTRIRRAVTDRIDRTRLFRFRLPWVIGGFGVVGLVLLGFFFFGGSDEGDNDAALALPSVAPVETTTPPSTEPVVVDAEAPAVAVAAPDLAAVPFAFLWSYTATKTADIVPPPEFLTMDPIGTVFPGILVVDQICEGDICRHESTYDLERTFLDQAEVGERSAAVWEKDGATWTVEMEAHTMQADYGNGEICVILSTQAWEVTVTEAVLVGDQWVASAFIGILRQGDSLDLAASTAGPDICGEWQAVDEWSLEGVAVG